MDSYSDQIKALVYSIAVHALCVLLITLGVAWTRANRPVSAEGPIIEAVLVDVDAMRRPRPKPPLPKPELEKPQPEKTPPPANLPPIPKENAKDRLEQEKIDRLAQETALEQKKEQEEKHKKEQEVLEQEERKTRLERERQKQLDDIRKQRADAQKKRELEEEKLAQLQDLQQKPQVKAPPQAPRAGTEGTDNDLRARYVAAIQSVVQQNWLRPDNAQPGLKCRLNITQIPGGEVIQAQVQSPCNADDLTRRSIEAAVLRAQPLPFQGYEKVFERNIVFNFSYDG